MFNHIVIEDTNKKPGFITPKGKDSNTKGRITKAMNDRKQISNDLKSKAVHKQVDFDKVRT